MLGLYRLGELGGIGGGTGDVKRDGDGNFNDILPCFLVAASKACFSGLASKFSSSYGCAMLSSQSLYSATLFTVGGRFNSWDDPEPTLRRTVDGDARSRWAFVDRYAGVSSLTTRDVSAGGGSRLDSASEEGASFLESFKPHRCVGFWST